jgi:hypothetical protein
MQTLKAVTVYLSCMMKQAEHATANDIELMNRAIELENAGIKAYDDAFSLSVLSAPVLEIAKGFQADHRAHAAALAAAVKAAGGTPTTNTTEIQYPSLKSEADILAFAEHVERAAATEYLTDVGNVSSPAIARLMASILGVETTHVATLAAALKEDRPYSGFVS